MEFRRNAAGREQLRAHLDGSPFVPPLRSYVDDFDAYVEKLLTRAERFEHWDGPELVGLVAVYCNDPDRRRAFVTMVSVRSGHTGRGLASALLERAIAHCAKLEFEAIELDVRRGNAAIELYRRLGFGEAGGESDVLRMRRELAAVNGSAPPAPAASRAANRARSG